MVALIEQGAPREAHPAYWAPFVVVGEGSAVEPSAKRLATSSIIAKPQAFAKVARQVIELGSHVRMVGAQAFLDDGKSAAIK
jgi:hypothetical protein